MNDQLLLITYKALCNFVNELCDEFGSKNKPLRLYMRLVNKTPVSQTKILSKHVTIFTDFCIKNRDGINSMDYNKFVEKTITYSERVYIDIYDFLSRCSDQNTVKVIWQHILTISALVDKESNAKQILREQKNNSSSQEDNFVDNLMGKIKETAETSSNPGDAISSLLGSGVLTDLVGDMQNGANSGQLNINKLLGVVQNLVGTLSDQADTEEAKQMTSMVSNMTNMLASATSNNQPLDPSSMIQMMSGLMSGLANAQTSPNVQAITENKEEKTD